MSETHLFTLISVMCVCVCSSSFDDLLPYLNDILETRRGLRKIYYSKCKAIKIIYLIIQHKKGSGYK